MYPLQVVYRKGKPYIRAAPCTIFFPTKNQIRARIAFGEIARKHKGKKGFDEEGLPIIASMIKKEYTGMRFGRKEKKPKWMEIYENYLRLKFDSLTHRIAKALAALEVAGRA